MNRYWYFAATLPSLQFGQPPPFGSAEFLERARPHLEAGDFAAILGATLSSPADESPGGIASPGLLAGYRYWERSLRNELARARARHLGRPTEAWVRPVGEYEGPVSGPSSPASLATAARAAAQAAFSAEDPLKGELLLERERWHLIEVLKAFHSFDFDTIAAWRLELQILERLALLRPEAGEVGWRETYADILSPARTIDMTGDPR